MNTKHQFSVKKALAIVATLLFLSTSYAQVSFGSYTMFPNNKLWGSAYKPQLAFGKQDDQYLLVLKCTSPTDYASFDGESLMLLRLGNDSLVRLQILSEEAVVKDYQTSWNSSLKRYDHFYCTYTCFVIDNKLVDLIVNNNEVIKKIRVSYTNGDVQDWDIDEKYQPKLTKGLKKSYEKVESQDAVRKEKISDVEAGF